MGLNNIFQEGTLGSILSNVEDSIEGINNDIKHGKSKMDPSVIGKVGDIADTINNGINSETINARSIISRARNSVMQFPVYVPPTIRINEVHIIAKLFERVYADFVSSVISQYPIIDEDEANNLGFLKKFHTNIEESARMIVNKYYEPIDRIDTILTESVFHEEKLSDTCVVEFSAAPNINEDLIVSESKRLAEDPLAGFGYYFKEDDEGIIGKSSKSIRSSKPLSDSDITRLIASDPKYILTKDEKTGHNNLDKKAAIDLIDGLDENEVIEKFKTIVRNGQQWDTNLSYKNNTVNLLSLDSLTSQVDKGVKRAVDTPMLLKDSDIKKTNGMAPFRMEVTFRLRNKNGVETKEVKYIIGIKTILHIIRTQDLADELRDLIMGNIQSLQKVRYKTGEITLADRLFNIKGLKADALKRTNTNKRWISTLKRLSNYNQLNGTVLKKVHGMASTVSDNIPSDVPIPNGTLILTQADILYLTQSTGIDLSVISNAKKLASSLFLIAIAIVDSTAGTMKVLFPDSDNSWDVQSLATIDAEIAKTDNSNLMKELNKMVNK